MCVMILKALNSKFHTSNFELSSQIYICFESQVFVTLVISICIRIFSIIDKNMKLAKKN